MAKNEHRLKSSLKNVGLSDSVIEAAWPDWWSEEAESSPSARAELRFSVARKLGLEPSSLFDDETPRFVWTSEAKFKNLSTEKEADRAALTSFGRAIAAALIAATLHPTPVDGLGAGMLRANILAKQKFVRLVDLLALCWAVGIPTIHLRIFPLSAKRMCAMAVRVGDRFAILLSKDSQYPSPTAYHLAHELGHIVLGHIGPDSALVDLQDPLQAQSTDNEELAADRFALELLTGNAAPTIEPGAENFTARQLADAVLAASGQAQIEPGTLALCLGHSTNKWPTVYAAMNRIYVERRPVWQEINRLASVELAWGNITDEMETFVRSVLGDPQHGQSSHR